MKEAALEVLMYLFENYLEDDDEPAPDGAAVRQELEYLGFPQREIEQALDWLDRLAGQDFSHAVAHSRPPANVRIYTTEEIKRLDLNARGFLLFLEQNGILEPASRELVIDRIMALDSEEIDLEHVKWVVLLVLARQPGRDEALAWMQDLVYEGLESTLH